MNVQEMHIEIDTSSQKIRSNYGRKFQTSEIDWLLNKHVDRFIKDRIKRDNDSLGFDATQIDLDALRTLSILDRELPTFKIEDDAVRAELPGNYSYLIDDSSQTIDKCDSRNYNLSTPVTNKTLYIYAFPLGPTVKANAPFYQSMAVNLNGASLFSVSNLPGLPEKSEVFAVRDYIMHKLWRYTNDQLQTAPQSTVDFYWEEFAGVRVPGNILAVCNTQQSSSNTIVIDGTSTVAAGSTITRNFYTPTGAGKSVPDRLIKGGYRASVRDSAFLSTRSNSPISAINANQIKVYHDKKFIVSKLRVSYIRKPAKINLLLNQNCDLAPEFHREICDRVTLDIKELTMSPDWELKMRDMMLNKD